MEYRNWSKNDIRTSLLGYGCMRFPTKDDGAIDEERAEALLNTAKAAGVNYFDTAYPYHNGQSEPFVGRVIARWDRSSFYLATKMPLWSCKNLDDAKRIFEEQFQRLGVEYIDFYLLHSLHRARYEKAKAMGLVDWLWQQKAAGRIRNFGFSCHDNSAGFEYILRDQPWDFCQLQYNYLDRDDRAEEVSGDRGYQLTEECGVPLIIMEPVKGGTLACRRRRTAARPASGCLRCLLGAALGGQPQQCACYPVRHERRGAADRQSGYLWFFPAALPCRKCRCGKRCRPAAPPYQGRLHRLPVLYALPHGGGHPGQFQHLEQAGHVRAEGCHQSPVDRALPGQRKGPALRALRQM